MSLINCKECGKQVSSTAASCPHCGAKIKKKTSKIALIFALIVLASVIAALLDKNNNDKSVNAGNESNSENKDNSGVLSYLVQDMIRKNAKDPDSVQFKNENFYTDEKYGAVVCGQYNGKNSFGAYTGFKGYVATEKDKTLYMQDSVNKEKFPEKWNKLCIK